MIQRELQQKDAENTLLTYILKVKISLLWINLLFNIILYIYVHFQHCFQNLSET